MPVKIMSVENGSIAARAGIGAGDTITSINGREVNDVLDYRFLISDERLSVALADGSVHTIKKEQYADIGLEFESYLMDSERTCRNKCVFCFVDQMPPGMRETLYFKDDDSRLSFLFGNYITLTNLTDREASRVIQMRLSPVNVSVHTMDPQLRCRMMGNPHAGECLRYLDRFARAGIDLNIQLVLCPGWNDGEALRFALRELRKLPTVRSIAAVPVGLTKYRENLTELRPFTKEEAMAVIDIFDEFRSESIEVCASDEFFLHTGQEMPGVEYYGEFRQIENGVGLWASFRQDVLEAIRNSEFGIRNETRITIATGVAAEPLLRFLVDEMQKTWHNIHINVRPVENRFFGEHITVAGLLTGRDVVEQLRGESLSERLLLPAAMFNRDGLTLDGMTLEEISQALGVPVRAVGNDAEELQRAIVGGGVT